jgi:hypothetical protein
MALVLGALGASYTPSGTFDSSLTFRQFNGYAVTMDMSGSDVSNQQHPQQEAI